jgi:MFS transporter, DHA1 family, inner membrane transport protein
MAKMNPRIAVLALATFASGTEAYVYAGLLSDLTRDLGVGLAQGGLLATAFAVTYAILAPPLASLTARWPRRTVLTAGLATVGLLNLAAAVSPTFAWLLASRIACGLVAALIGPSASAAASALVPPEQRGRAMAMVAAGTSLAFTLGVPLGSIVGGAYGWRATFVFAGLLLLACALAIRLVLPVLPQTDRTGLATLKIAMSAPVARRLAITALAFVATFASISYLGPTANIVAGAEGGGVGPFQACIGIGSVVGIVIGGRLADKPRAEHQIWMLFMMIAVTQLGFVAAFTTGSPAILAFSIAAGAVALFALIPIVQASLIRIAPEQRGVVLALNGSMVFLGQGLGAVVGGAVVAGASLKFNGLAGAAVALVVILIVTLSQRRRTGSWRD